MEEKIYKKVKIRKAVEDDCRLLLEFIKKLAKYEGKLDKVSASESDLHRSIFEERLAGSVFLEIESIPVGYAVYFYILSTFSGKPVLYIEDIFIDDDFRDKGFGKFLFSYLADLSIKKGCSRLEWSVLSWNKPSIAFYKKFNAKQKKGWENYYLEDEDLKDASSYFKKHKHD